MTMPKFARSGCGQATLLTAALGLFAASPSYAETLTITDIAPAPMAMYEVSIPTVEIVDGNLTEETVRRIFSGTPGSALDSLATLDAASVRIPTISMSYDLPDEKGEMHRATVVYRDFELRDVRSGVAASSRLAGGDMDLGIGGLKFEFDEMRTATFDLSALLGFYGVGPLAGGTAMNLIYNDFAWEGGRLTGDSMSCEIGGSSPADFSARPLKRPFSDITELTNQLQLAVSEKKEPPPAAISGLIDIYIDLLTAIESTPMVMEGFACEGSDEKGRAMKVSSGPLTVGGFQPGIYPEFQVDDFKIDVKDDGFMQFGNFTLKPIDFTNTFAILQAASGELNEAWFAANYRKLIPSLDGLSVEGFAMDIPDDDKPGERIKASLGLFDVTLGQYVNGVPADLSFRIADLLLPVPEDMSDGPAKELLALGIKEVNLGLGSTLSWNEADRTIRVEDMFVDAGQLGHVTLSGTLGNATPDLFSENPEVAMLAAQSLTVKDVTIDLEDRGMANIVIAAGARDNGQPEPAFRMTMAGMIQGMTLSVLGNSDEALKVAQALGTFISGAPQLKVTLTAKDEAGIGLADLAGVEQDPRALVGKLTITAEASGEPLPAAAKPAEEPAEPRSVQQQKLELKNPAPAAQ